MISNLIIILISYVLGSIPFGFIISKIFSGKNILEIGWRKTSGSNVFKNIGKWQGVLTGILDIGKGFLAVWLSQKLGFSISIQAICGVMAVTGHNWSCFLDFSGGRGIATFGGALLAFSSQIFWISLIPIILVTFIWNAAIGTILSLITAIILSFYFNQLGSVSLFVFLSLIPIFIKRLSPLKEISLNRKKEIRNRLIFDDDMPRWDLRIKRIILKLKSNLTKR
jgi:glycerol-3-phosphate acyltransferase PlsY